MLYTKLFLGVISLFGLISSISATEYTDSALKDQITSLPGLNTDINFNQFSGYLRLADTNKYIHYWLVESESDPSTDPLVFWTNGGPGCSGLIGFMTEQGPFRPDKDGNLNLNDWRWNKISNMVFIEQPVGVGFSYSDNSDDYKIGDDQAAIDNLHTILSFLEKFPKFNSSPLYITSESYGGHYMPMLAQNIIEYGKLNFKGFAVGNPYTNYYSGIGAEIETYWGKQLISQPSWNKYVSNGCLDTVNQFNNSICTVLILDFMNMIGNLNPYALDYPVCVTAQQTWMSNYIRGDLVKMHPNMPIKDSYEPCEDSYSTEYLNNVNVKNSIHVHTDIVWEECSRTVKYEYIDKLKPMEHYYNSILNSKSNPDVRILVYSGDDDSVCGTIGTQKWIWDLGFPVKSEWKTWMVDGQTAGYTTHFKTPFSNDPRLSFITVHYAGHEVPTYKPKEAFILFQSYLNNDYN